MSVTSSRTLNGQIAFLLHFCMPVFSLPACNGNNVNNFSLYRIENLYLVYGRANVKKGLTQVKMKVTCQGH